MMQPVMNKLYLFNRSDSPYVTRPNSYVVSAFH